MKNIALVAVAIASATISTGAVAQVALTNGGFEQTGEQYSTALGGLNAATGWTNTSNLNIQASSALSGVEGTAPATDARFLRLVSDSPDPQNTGSIFQRLGTVQTGVAYTLTGTALGGDSIGQGWGGIFTLSAQLDGSNPFASTSVIGLARGASTTFSFGFVGTGATAGQSLFLHLAAIPSAPGTDTRGGVDNLQLATSAVPEPATWGMMLFGFGAMGLAMRRSGKVRTAARFA